MEDFRVKTLSGGMGMRPFSAFQLTRLDIFQSSCFLVSVISSVVIVLLAIQETRHYLAGDVVEQLYVDSTSSDVRLDVHFDVTFHRLPCACKFCVSLCAT